jgi:hypothetical protein
MADNLERAQSAVWQRITAAPRQGGLFV